MMLSAPDLKRYWQALNSVAPAFGVDEEYAAVVIYRELAHGHRIADDRVAAIMRRRPDEARRLLESEAIRPDLYRNDEGRIAGFGGLAVMPRHHRLSIGGRQLWTEDTRRADLLREREVYNSALAELADLYGSGSRASSRT